MQSKFGSKRLKNALRRAMGATVVSAAVAVAPAANAGGPHNYAEVLQKSMFFYEAQRSGRLPANNRVIWRGDSTLDDGADVGHDLTGGWFDAADHVKFNFPMAFSLTALAWGYLEYRDAYQTTGQEPFLLDNLRWAADYLLRCHTAPNELYAQVGDGDEDHRYWVPAEVVHLRSRRPSYKIDAEHPGSDLAGETAAALAAASLAFAESDPTYSDVLLSHARQIYEFADRYRGKYSDVVPAGNFYRSWSGYQDELLWGAIWLYRATGESDYLARAEAAYEQLAPELGEQVKPYTWTISWDDKSYGAYVLLAQMTGRPTYRADAERFLERWLVDRQGGKGPRFTPAGFPILDSWGSFRYAANTAFLLRVYADTLAHDPDKQRRYAARAKQIADYLLGDNPRGLSYVIGYGPRYPLAPHHRTAHGSWTDNLRFPELNRHVLHGALVGGHRNADDNDWKDDRGDFLANEVACDYNALFSGLIAALVRDHGGAIDPAFPPVETPDVEMAAEAKINAEWDQFTEVAVWVLNQSGWPAHASEALSFRYFVDLSEGIEAGYSPGDYQIQLNVANGAQVSRLLPWDPARGIYYVEVSFSGVAIYPGGQGQSRREAQLRIAAPDHIPWDPRNDWSYQGLSRDFGLRDRIPVYDDGQRVFGQEPSRAGQQGSPGGDVPQRPQQQHRQQQQPSTVQEVGLTRPN
jgi:endoglucanase